MLWKAEKRGPGAAPGCNSGVVVCVVQCRFRLVDRPPVGLSVIPSPREMGGMECCDRSRWVGSIKRDDHAARGAGIMTPAIRTHRCCGAGGCSCRRRCWWPGRVQGADVVIAQAVEDQPDQLAGRGNNTDVAAAPGRDPIPGLPEAGMSGKALHGFDRGPTDQPGALFICGTTVVKPCGIRARDFFLDLLRWPLGAVGRCRGPGSGVSPTA
jgi:hypothetical protein